MAPSIRSSPTPIRVNSSGYSVPTSVASSACLTTRSTSTSSMREPTNLSTEAWADSNHFRAAGGVGGHRCARPCVIIHMSPRPNPTPSFSLSPPPGAFP